MSVSNHDTPEVRSTQHDERPESQMHRARSHGGTAVSVRTTRGRVDYIYAANRRWGGPVEHEEAEALAEQLHAAIEVAETPDAGGYFRARTPAGVSVSVRISRPVTRWPEFTAGGIDYVRVGAGAWGGSTSHDVAVALHACLRAALEREKEASA